MIKMLELKQKMTVCDFGAGCGLTANTFAKFGCKVTAYDPKAKSLMIAKKYAKKLSVSVDY